MKGEVGEERGVKARKLGGGQICLMGMFGTDIPFRMHSGCRMFVSYPRFHNQLIEEAELLDVFLA